MTTTTKTTTRKSGKQPTDHLPPQAPPAGHDLLKPAASLLSHERLEIMADISDALVDLGFDMETGEGPQDIAKNGATIRALASLHRAIYQVIAPDRDVLYREFATGAGAEEQVTDLAIWYFGQLGE